MLPAADLGTWLLRIFVYITFYFLFVVDFLNKYPPFAAMDADKDEKGSLHHTPIVLHTTSTATRVEFLRHRPDKNAPSCAAMHIILFLIRKINMLGCEWTWVMTGE